MKLLPPHLTNTPLQKMEIIPETVARHMYGSNDCGEPNPEATFILQFLIYSSGNIAEAEDGKIVRVRKPGLD